MLTDWYKLQMTKNFRIHRDQSLNSRRWNPPWPPSHICCCCWSWRSPCGWARPPDPCRSGRWAVKQSNWCLCPPGDNRPEWLKQCSPCRPLHHLNVTISVRKITVRSFPPLFSPVVMVMSQLSYPKSCLLGTWRQKWPDRSSGCHHRLSSHHRTRDRCRSCPDRRPQRLQRNTLMYYPENMGALKIHSSGL